MVRNCSNEAVVDTRDQQYEIDQGGDIEAFNEDLKNLFVNVELPNGSYANIRI